MSINTTKLTQEDEIEATQKHSLEQICWGEHSGKVNSSNLPGNLGTFEDAVRSGDIRITVKTGTTYTFTFDDSDYVLETAFFYISNEEYDATICYNPEAGWNLDVRDNSGAGSVTVESMTDIESVHTASEEFN